MRGARSPARLELFSAFHGSLHARYLWCCAGASHRQRVGAPCASGLRAAVIKYSTIRSIFRFSLTLFHRSSESRPSVCCLRVV